MEKDKTQFITDNNGKKISVVIPIKKYQLILEDLEELDDIKRYDRAKATADKGLPIEEAFAKIEKQRKK